MALSVDIEKRLGAFRLCVSFEAGDEAFGLLGASGCGKSMTLKCIAGIERPDRGRIVLDGRVLFDSAGHIDMPVRKRRVGYLFQDYALFPNMTVFDNLCCGIPGNRRERRRKAGEYLERFYLTGLEEHYPWQLSGGQRQRAALARMLAAKPDILMLDEPFTALDNDLKWQLERELMDVISRFGGTTLFVSHDRNEAYRLTERIAVMEAGALVEVRDKRELFAGPRTLAAALLTGCKNVTRIERRADGRFFAADWGIFLKAERGMETAGYAGFRAHYFEPAVEDAPENVLECEILRVVEDTFSVIVLFRQKGNPAAGDRSLLRYELSKEAWSRLEGQGCQTLRLRIPPEKLMLLERRDALGTGNEG